MTTPADPRPLPQRDLDNADFWQGLAQRELRLQRCARCERHRYPPLPSCPYCGEAGGQVGVSPGRGSLYTFIVVHHAFSPAFANDVPYTLGTVELDEGCRMLARLELAGRPAEIGMRLEIAFRRHETGSPESDWSEAFFVAGAEGG